LKKNESIMTRITKDLQRKKEGKGKMPTQSLQTKMTVKLTPNMGKGNHNPCARKEKKKKKKKREKSS